MAPVIHLVRHAQGFHNLSTENESIRDPDLTPLGIEQCAALHASFPSHNKLTKLIASPLRRTLYTALYSFAPSALPSSKAGGGTSGSQPSAEQRLLPVYALDILQEVSAEPCDTGSSADALSEEFNGAGRSLVDVTGVRKEWTDKKSKESVFEPTLPKLMSRGQQARRKLRDMVGSLEGDAEVAVVLHGAFVHFLTDDWHGIPLGSATGWKNCEYRSYQFVDALGQDEDAALVETEQSWKRRQGDTIAPTVTEQREMRAVVQKRLSPYLKVVA